MADIYSDPTNSSYKINVNLPWDINFAVNYSGSQNASYYSANLSVINANFSGGYPGLPSGNNNYNYTPPLLNTSSACVTMYDLENYGSQDMCNVMNCPQANYARVIPENFCYAIITYNISHFDYNMYVDKSLQAYMMYKKTMALYRVLNYTSSSDNIDNSCIGILRLLYCLYQFPFCVDNGNGVWTEKGICKNYCDLYTIRCAQFAIPEICQSISDDNQSCAGVYGTTNFLNLLIYSHIAFIIMILF